MIAHTPGPWKTEDYATVWAGNYEVAKIRKELPEQQDNARLIAAAPRLLAALQEIAKGEGPYKREPLAFAESVIDNLVKIATEALSEAT